MRRATIVLLTGILASVACQESLPQNHAVVRDSAGVSIVESPQPLQLNAADFQWRLTLGGEVATVGEDESEEPLVWEPEGAARIADGSLVVADRGPERLVLLRGQSVVERFAIQGKGPGEITAPGAGLALRPMPDGSIIVVELWGNRRIHRYASDGRFMEDIPMENFASSWSVGRWPSEITIQLATPGEHQGMAFAQHVARLDLETGAVETVHTLARTTTTLGPQPAFYPLRYWTAFRSGGFVTMRTDSGQVQYYDGNGSLVRTIRLPMTPRPATQEVVNKLESMYPEFPIEKYAETLRMFRRLVTVDDTLFAIEHSWLSVPVEDAPPLDEEIVWRLVSTSGYQRGSVSFPESFTPWRVEGGSILGVHRDSLGVGTIREYVLSEPTRR